MKRLVAVASASFALFLAACDDDDPKRPDAGREAGAEVSSEVGGEVGAPGACIGTFAGTNRTMLGAYVNAQAGAKCASAADLDAICTSDIGGQIRTKFAPTCLQASGGNNATVASCIEAGVKNEYMISSGCLGCYTASVICTVQNCFQECAANPAAAACTTCQTQKGCLSEFFSCSGLPGGPPRGDGGADVGGGDARVDGGTDTPADAPVDGGADTAADAATDTGSDV